MDLDPQRARDLRQNGDIVPMTTARENVLRNYPGAQFLDARITRAREGGPLEIHAVIMNRGRRVVVRLDARTGHFLGEGAPPPAPPRQRRR